MPYTPYTWKRGDIIDENRLNYIEEGIADITVDVENAVKVANESISASNIASEKSTQALEAANEVTRRADNGEFSVTHQWNGTVLSVTSSSGTTSADLKGLKGDSYILTPADKKEIASMIQLPDAGEGGNIYTVAINNNTSRITDLTEIVDKNTNDIETVIGITGNKQDIIADIDTIRAGAAKGFTALQSHQDISGKQDVIPDIDTIRAGAAKGFTALQSHQSLSGKQDVISDLSTIRSNAANGYTRATNGLDAGWGGWSSSTTYSVGSYAIYNNGLWRAVVQNTNSAPSTSNSNWKIVSIKTVDEQANTYTVYSPTSLNSSSVQTNMITLHKFGRIAMITGYFTMQSGKTFAVDQAIFNLPSYFKPMWSTRWSITGMGAKSQKSYNFIITNNGGTYYVCAHNTPLDHSQDTYIIVNATWVTES